MNLSEAEEFLSKRVARKQAASRPAILDDPDVFPEERACALDAAPLKVVFCTRRAAKSFSFGLEAINDSYDWPGGKYLFLGMTREEAKRIFWADVLKVLDRKHGLGIRFNESSLVATMPNGAEIVIGAADANEQEMRKLLGQKYRRVCIDEAQDWTHTDLHDLVYSVLKPACADLGGSISMRGTPGKFLKGFFRQLTPPSVQAGVHGAKGSFPGWSLHCWDTTANMALMPPVPGKHPAEPMSVRWAREIAELKASHPGIEETPAFRRNYLGEWVLDESNLVYRYQAGRNDYDALPALRRDGWHYVLGIDLGYDDATAHVLWAYHDDDPTLYGVKAEKESGLDITSTAQKTQRYVTAYHPEALIVDGANKQAVEEMRRRHNLPLQAADKTGKADFIEIMNAEYTMGRIKLGPECGPLKDEYAALVWADGDKREEHPACDNHAADGALYGWRRCYAFLSERPVPPPPPGSEAWAQAEAQRMEQAAQEEYERRQEANEASGWEEWG